MKNCLYSKLEVLVDKKFLNTKKEIMDIQGVFNILDPTMFPTLTQIIQIIALTIPVNSCSCERSFSVSRRLHTWLRSTMGQGRLHQLSLLSIEKEQLCKVSQSHVIDRFATMKARRYSLIVKKLSFKKALCSSVWPYLV